MRGKLIFVIEENIEGVNIGKNSLEYNIEDVEISFNRDIFACRNNSLAPPIEVLFNGTTELKIRGKIIDKGEALAFGEANKKYREVTKMLVSGTVP